MNLETVIFDFDGTLVDSEKITFELASPIISKYVGREITESDLASYKGKAWKTAFKEWVPNNYEKLYHEIVKSWEEIDPVLPLYPEVINMIQALHQKGVAMGIASARERSLIVRDLRRLSINKYFDVVVGQEDTYRHKPDPEPLLLVSELLGTENSDCVYIGDQVSDIQASRSAGMLSGAAAWGEGIRSALKDANPDYLFSKPMEVVESLFS